MAIKYKYPYEDSLGIIYPNLISHYSDCGYRLIELVTGATYEGEVIDDYPCPYQYIEEIIEEQKEDDFQ